MTAELILLAILISQAVKPYWSPHIEDIRQTSTGNLERECSSGRARVGSALGFCVQVKDKGTIIH